MYYYNDNLIQYQKIKVDWKLLQSVGKTQINHAVHTGIIFAGLFILIVRPGATISLPTVDRISNRHIVV